MVSTVGHELHKKRRGYLASFFSKQSIYGIEFLIQEKINILVTRVAEDYRHDKPIDAYHLFSALTADVISHYSYGESFGLLNTPDYSGKSVEGTNSMLKAFHIMRFFPFLRKLPQWLARRLSDDVAGILDFQTYLQARAKETLEAPKTPDLSKGTIFEALVGPSIPKQERTVQRVADEAMIVQLAGIDTTSRALTTGLYHLLREPRVLEKLKQELRTVIPRRNARPTLRQLEQLPYLVNVHRWPSVHSADEAT
jgi:cytochrome P450